MRRIAVQRFNSGCSWVTNAIKKGQAACSKRNHKTYITNYWTPSIPFNPGQEHKDSLFFSMED